VPRSPAADHRDEVVLLARLRAGDEAAFAWLVDQYSPPLLRLAAVYVSSRASAEEVVQETWVGVIRGIDGFQGRSSIKTWIYRILMNIARTRGARETRSVPFSSAATALDEGGGPAFDPERFLRATSNGRGTGPLSPSPGRTSRRIVFWRERPWIWSRLASRICHRLSVR
jgi:RNA polymerase sigma-70 factor (ECF subfamily)